MKWIGRLLDRFWFADAPAARLALLRILIGLFILHEMADHYSAWVKVGGTNESLFAPVGVVSVLDKPLSPDVFQALLTICIVLNVLFILGWRHRYIAPVFALLLLWVLTYRNSWSMIYHSANLPVLHILILGLTPAADALSLDAWRRRRAGMPNPCESWRYGWPIKLICAITVATYLLSGVAKVAGPLGWSWATADALRSQVAADALRKEVLGDSGSPLFYKVYDQDWLFAVLAVGSLAMELGAPIALLDRRLGYVWAVTAFLMHWGIFAIMSITFAYQLCGVCFASFFPLERLVNWRSKSATEAPKVEDQKGEG
jgi:hypothetical protein